MKKKGIENRQRYRRKGNFGYCKFWKLQVILRLTDRNINSEQVLEFFIEWSDGKKEDLEVETLFPISILSHETFAPTLSMNRKASSMRISETQSFSNLHFLFYPRR